MHYNLRGTGVSITPEIRNYLEKRIRPLDKHVKDIDATRIDVELQYRESEAKMYRVELMLHDGAIYRAEALGEQLYEAIDLAVGELSRVMTQGKKKRLHVLRHTAVKVKEFLRGWRKKV